MQEEFENSLLADKNATDYTQAMLIKTQGNTELALTLFNKLFEQLPVQIAEIKLALEQNNLKKARQTCHILHGSVAFCGLLELQQCAYHMEKNLANNMLSQIDLTVLELNQLIDQLLQQKANIIEILSPKSTR